MQKQKFPAMIPLRGHHVFLFFDYILWRYAPPAWKVFSSLAPKYGEEFTEHLKELFGHLYDHPNRLILIVENIPDAVCDGRCRKREDGCFKQTDHDQVAADCYGLKIGEKYPAGYFINEIKTKEKIGEPVC